MNRSLSIEWWVILFYLGTIVALLDLLFIFFVVPESLPERLRTDQKISWAEIDPFSVSFEVYFPLMKGKAIFFVLNRH